ncbi:MAG TPA: MFS transporter [Chthonomonadaceae bacterium]|nr:MFS transporter [Chthonomonadaceae bacterium]
MTAPAPPAPNEIERSVVRTLTWRLLPFLALLYMFNILDRNNVTLAGPSLQKDLNFSNTVYGFCGGLFFVGYFLLEVPSNLIMERVGARRWIARIMITWGAISASMMFIRTPFSFGALRILLGMAEAGFFPGIMLYLTYWVPRSARAQVIARFLAMTAFVGIAGNPLSGALLRMNHVHHLAGWQWLFLLEGIPSILLGLLVWVVLPNSPETTSWLTSEQKQWIASSLERENTNVHLVHHKSVFATLRDRRVLHVCLIFLITSIGGNCAGFFAPKLIIFRSGMTWPDWLVANWLTVPAIFGVIAMVLAAGHSDRTGNRKMHVVAGYFLAGCCYLAFIIAPTPELIILAMAVNTLGERVAAGSYWAVTTNLLGSRSAAGGIAFINSVGNLGGFIGPWMMGILLDRSHGNFTPGLVTGFVFMMGGVVASLLLPRRAPEHSAPPWPDAPPAESEPVSVP